MEDEDGTPTDEPTTPESDDSSEKNTEVSE